MNQISLMEEFLLLTLEDEGGEFDKVPEIFTRCGVAGAALMDLALRNRIDSDLTGIWCVDPTPVGDPALDLVLSEISAETARLTARHWIERLAKQGMALRSHALAHLCNLGILRQHDAEFLWVLKSRRYPVLDGQERQEAKRRIMSLLYTDEIPHPTDIALIGISHACAVFERILTPKEYASARARIEQIAGMDLIGREIARTAHEVNVTLQKAERVTAIAGLAGNVMEWYDFAVYGFFAATIGKLFFPSLDATVSLLASFGVFAAGFLARPIGAAVFGYIGDRIGRRAAVIGSVLAMVVPTFVMGLLPTYAQIGIAAPIILIAMRFIQGLSVGGEYTTSMVLLVEDSRPNRRGHLGSYANFGAIGGMLLGSAVGATLLGLLPPEAAASWGWRFAFLSGLLIGIVVFVIRRRLPADEIIVAHEADRKSPLLEAFRTQWSTMLRMIAVMFASNVGFYLCFIYLSTWLQQNDHLPASTTLLMNCIALGTLMAVTPWFGGLSDRFGRKPILLIGGLSLALLAIPVFHILGTGQILPIVIAQCVLALALCAANTSSAFLVEAFPKHVRCSALAISYNFSAAAFGGTAPLVAVYLTKTLSTPIAPAFYLLGAAIVSIAALMISRSEYVPGQA